MSKKPQYDPEEIRYPDQKIITSSLVPEMENSYMNTPCRLSWAGPCPTCGTA